jgi:hypothetical protein
LTSSAADAVLAAPLLAALPPVPLLSQAAAPDTRRAASAAFAKSSFVMLIPPSESKTGKENPGAAFGKPRCGHATALAPAKLGPYVTPCRRRLCDGTEARGFPPALPFPSMLLKSTASFARGGSAFLFQT